MKKNIILFSVSFVVTIILFLCIILLFNIGRESKEEYGVNSVITVENKKEVITDSCIELSDCLNAEDNFELKISAGSGDERKVKYEISFLMGYEQVPFTIKDEEYSSYIFNNSANITIQIQKKYFMMKNNSLLILMRQDIEKYADSSELVRDTPPLILRYNIMRKDGKVKKKNDATIDITDEVVDNEDDIIHLENSSGKEVKSCHVKRDGEMNLSALLNSTMTAGEYIVFACYDSIQVKINDNKKIYINKKKEGKLNFRVCVPEKEGKYDLELFFVPLPYDVPDDGNFEDYSVIFSQKQTVNVE